VNHHAPSHCHSTAVVEFPVLEGAIGEPLVATFAMTHSYASPDLHPERQRLELIRGRNLRTVSRPVVVTWTSSG